MKFNKTLRKKCNTIHILPSDEGVMVDYHTKKKIITLDKVDYHTRKKYIGRDEVGW